VAIDADHDLVVQSLEMPNDRSLLVRVVAIIEAIERFGQEANT
jgi:hypothetical protein